MFLPSFLRSWVGWAGHHLAWSNSRQSWQERLAGAAVLAAAVVVWWASARLPAALLTLLLGALLVTLALLSRRGWLRFFGPVLFYDLVRTARRKQFLFLRCLYAAFLLGVLFAVGAAWFADRHHSPWNIFTTFTLPPREMAELAEAFFWSVMGMQVAAVFLLTPAYTSGAIAEEKDHRTLEYLFASDLRNREIVLSLLASRLANLGLVLLTGLPIVSLVQLLGGIDPNLVLAGFAAIALTTLSLGSLGILSSVYARKPRDAIGRTYLVVVMYLVISSLGEAAVKLWPKAAAFPSTDYWESPITLVDVVDGMNIGNLGVVVYELGESVVTGSTLDELLPAALGDYAAFHGLVAFFCCGWAILRLRAVGLRQPAPAVLAFSEGGVRVRPRIGPWPMLWKEIVIEGRSRSSTWMKVGAGFLVLVSFVPAIAILVFFALQLPFVDWDDLGSSMHIWLLYAGTSVACLMLLQVAVRAAGSVTGERDHQTLDSLLTSPLDSTALLFAKWVGSVLGPRWIWAWLILIWALGIITWGLDPWAVIDLVAAWVVLAAFFAALGIWFSVVGRSTMRATLWTLLAVLIVSAGHWLIWACIEPLSELVLGPSLAHPDLIDFQLYGLTPPMTLVALEAPYNNLRHGGWFGRDPEKEKSFAQLGLILWGLGAVVLWIVASARFRVLIGRSAVRRPEKTSV